MSPRYTDDERRKWVARYLELGSYRRAAAEFGISPMTLHRVVIATGVERRTSPRYSDEEKSEWIRLFLLGESLSEIAAERHVSVGAVRSYLRKQGHEPPRIRRYSPDEKRAWVESYRSCGSVTEVANASEVPTSTVALHLSQQGLDTSRERKISEAEIGNWIEAYEACGSTREVAAKFGRLQGTVYNYLKARGVIKIADTVTQTHGLEINRLHQIDNLTGDEIARRLNIPKPTVYAHLRDHGFPRGFSETNRVRADERHRFFDEIDTEEKAYWLGFLVADGHVKSGGIVFTLSDRDQKHLERFAARFNAQITNFERTTPQGNPSKMCTMQFGSMYMAERLANYGLAGNKRHSPEMGAVFDVVPSHLMHHFVRGVFDGDGCLTFFNESSAAAIWTRATWGITGNKAFIPLLRDQIVAACGVSEAVVHDIRKATYSAHIMWHQLEEILVILKWIYTDASIALPRKFETARVILRGEEELPKTINWLKEQLANGPVSIRSIRQAAQRNGISEVAVRLAESRMDLKRPRPWGIKAPAGWALPDHKA